MSAEIIGRIEALETEAGEARDLEQVELCRRALAGDEDAVRRCERALRDADAARAS